MMADILVRKAKKILEAAVGLTPKEAAAAARRWQRSLARRRISDSAELIREDRQR